MCSSVQTMDVLTNILESLPLVGSLHCRTELKAPWGMTFPASTVMAFHVVDEGSCWLKLGETPTLLEAGDSILLAPGQTHSLSDKPETPSRAVISLDGVTRECQRLSYGEDGDRAVVLCGKFQLESDTPHPLHALLLPVIHLKGQQPWLKTTLRLLAAEANANGPGSQTILRRLTDVLFVQILRAWLETQNEPQSNWLSALRDPKIGAALSLIHEFPERAWTVANLAAEVRLARTTFATRFTGLVGEPPLTYLTQWRMHLAARLLRGEGLTLKAVAERVGYESEAAFSHAFKRVYGLAPGGYRRSATPKNHKHG